MNHQAPLLPIFVKLTGRRCLVVGAGRVALQKVESLLQCGAEVEVVAPQAVEELQSLAANGKIRLNLREYAPSDLDGAFLAIAATNRPEVNQVVFNDANARNIPINAVDDPPNCDFYFSSVVRRGDLQVAVSTAGQSPAFAQRLRKEIDALLPSDIGEWLSNLGQLRREVLETHPAGEDRNHLLGTLATRQVCNSAECPSRKLVQKQQNIENSWWLS
jgi:siroheme synthase-like protein